MNVPRREFNKLLSIAAGAIPLGLTSRGMADYLSLQSEDRLVIGDESPVTGKPNAEEYLFIMPRDVVVDMEGNIYVLDQRDRVIKKFSRDGTFVSKFGGEGQGPGEFQTPIMLRTDGANSLFVYDMRRRLIQKFDTDGNFLDVSFYTAEVTTWMADFQVYEGNVIILHGFNRSDEQNIDELRIFHIVDG